VSEVVAIGDVGQPARVVGRSPWALAGRRLLRNRIALVALAGFVVIVVACLAAGWYAHSVAHTHPFSSTVDGTTLINGKQQPVMVESTGGLGLGVTPIGPTWDIHHYFLGADSQGRDVAARMLYGGRNSLIIGLASAAICCFIATIIALIAGFFGGIVDQILSRILDIIWAFPVFLAAISISTVALTSGIPIGPVTLSAGSIWLPIIIVSFVFVPYVGRPIRGQVLAIREREFVEAAIGLGASNLRLIFAEVLPNVLTTVIVFFPLMVANNMLVESALSFLSIGVQPPDASWGTIISDGQGLLYTRPWVAIAPGLAIVATVLCLNVLGDGVRDALDPRARLRAGRR
jgi:peptide/nickel transport system permease protein